jgi:methylisocitrate lyase
MAQGPVMLPGVFNALSAQVAYKSGAKALYLAGSATVNSLLAMPDIALITQTEMAQQAGYVCQAAPLPVISDADTGYGDGLNVRRTVIEMERSGLAGIHLEDQASPKRCGHLDGKSLIDPRHMAAKVLAAVGAKKDPNFLIVARTDARGVEGIDAAIDRAKLYADHGADAIFPEGLTSEAEFEEFRRGVSVPLLANMTEFGKTPIIPFTRFGAMGYNLVIYPNAAFRVVLKAMCDTYSELVEKGTQAGMIGKMRTRKELYEIIDYDDYEEMDESWAQRASEPTG